MPQIKPPPALDPQKPPPTAPPAVHLLHNTNNGLLYKQVVACLSSEWGGGSVHTALPQHLIVCTVENRGCLKPLRVFVIGGEVPAAGPVPGLVFGIPARHHQIWIADKTPLLRMWTLGLHVNCLGMDRFTGVARVTVVSRLKGE
ncbi:unnamed protein product [Gadus morhua 'NCC']